MASEASKAALALALRKFDEAEKGAIEVHGKRKTRWSSGGVKTKGKRWGPSDEKEYKPLPYVDLPVGFTEKETDLFLREQRLEELDRKLKLGELEDVDEDIRAPSPPPTYDANGNRTNSREVRIKRAMDSEYSRLVRFMMKHVPGYTAPAHWKPDKLMKKLIIPVKRYPDVNFMGIIVGARGQNHKRLQQSTNCKIEIRGQGVQANPNNMHESNMPQHVHIEGDKEDDLDLAEKLILPLLDPTRPEFEQQRQAGLEQLAIVHGVDLQVADMKCLICGALGHSSNNCPENQFLNYKFANVQCAICGDKGHVTADCPQKLKEQKEENENWQEKAERDAEYKKMMEELGVKPTTADECKPCTDPKTQIKENAFLLPDFMASKFIGSKGANIKSIQQEFGCKIVVNTVNGEMVEVELDEDSWEQVFILF